MRRALVALKKNGGTGVIRRETIGTPGAITQRVASRLSQELFISYVPKTEMVLLTELGSQEADKLMGRS